MARLRRVIDGLFSARIGLPLLGALLLLLALLPLALPARSYWLQLMFTVFVFAVMGHAWNLMAGYCGLLSFGNQVYVGLGAFAMAIAFYYGGLPIWAAWLFSGIAGLGFAYLLAVPLSQAREGGGVKIPVLVAVVLWILYEILLSHRPDLDVFQSDYVRRVAIVLLIFLGALPLLRLQGPYFAIATWLIAESVSSVFNEWRLVGAGGGMAAKGVDYDGFPVDIGTIVANAAVNPHGEIPLVIAANNLYHDWDRTRRLGEIAVACAVEQGKRVVAIGIGNLSGTLFRDERPLADDAVASEADDSWNRQILDKIASGDLDGLLAEIPIYSRDAKVDMGFKHLGWLLGCLGEQYKGAIVHAYGPAYGCGTAVIEFPVGTGGGPGSRQTRRA